MWLLLLVLFWIAWSKHFLVFHLNFKGHTMFLCTVHDVYYEWFEQLELGFFQSFFRNYFHFILNFFMDLWIMSVLILQLLNSIRWERIFQKNIIMNRIFVHKTSSHHKPLQNQSASYDVTLKNCYLIVVKHQNYQYKFFFLAFKISFFNST